MTNKQMLRVLAHSNINVRIGRRNPDFWMATERYRMNPQPIKNGKTTNETREAFERATARYRAEYEALKGGE